MARGDQSSRRTVPARVRDFLRDRPGRVYCDTCIQERLGLKWRQQAQLITATLGVTSEFERGRWLCSTCNQTKFGISARRAQDAGPAKDKEPDEPEPAQSNRQQDNPQQDNQQHDSRQDARVVMKLNRSR